MTSMSASTIRMENIVMNKHNVPYRQARSVVEQAQRTMPKLSHIPSDEDQAKKQWWDEFEIKCRRIIDKHREKSCHHVADKSCQPEQPQTMTLLAASAARVAVETAPMQNQRRVRPSVRRSPSSSRQKYRGYPTTSTKPVTERNDNSTSSDIASRYSALLQQPGPVDWTRQTERNSNSNSLYKTVKVTRAPRLNETVLSSSPKATKTTTRTITTVTTVHGPSSTSRTHSTKTTRCGRRNSTCQTPNQAPVLPGPVSPDDPTKQSSRRLVRDTNSPSLSVSSDFAPKPPSRRRSFEKAVPHRDSQSAPTTTSPALSKVKTLPILPPMSALSKHLEAHGPKAPQTRSSPCDNASGHTSRTETCSSRSNSSTSTWSPGGTGTVSPTSPTSLTNSPSRPCAVVDTTPRRPVLRRDTTEQDDTEDGSESMSPHQRHVQRCYSLYCTNNSNTPGTRNSSVNNASPHRHPLQLSPLSLSPPNKPLSSSTGSRSGGSSNLFTRFRARSSPTTRRERRRVVVIAPVVAMSVGPNLDTALSTSSSTNSNSSGNSSASDMTKTVRGSRSQGPLPTRTHDCESIPKTVATANSASPKPPRRQRSIGSRPL